MYSEEGICRRSPLALQECVVTISECSLNSSFLNPCMKKIDALAIAVERQKIVVCGCVFFEAGVLIEFILIQPLSPQG
ncbi:hypothetical protein LH31_26265 [Pseudomonas aeruginosa]|nr:hypothetical protein LH31_26265 [Pseudomonas aeruginosa]